jgi:elongation factor G
MNGKFDYTLKKQSGGPGQYARVIGRIEAYDDLFAFENRVIGGAIPSEFIKPCEQGFRDATQTGIVAGYPVMGIKVVLEGGDYHPVDSNDCAFRFAACQGFYQGMATADPVVLEPVMQVTIEVPSNYIGVVQGDLMARRGAIDNLEFTDDRSVMTVRVPMAAMFGYATTLRTLCSGQGEFSMTFSHYQPVREKSPAIEKGKS